MSATPNDILRSLRRRQIDTRWGIGTARQYVNAFRACIGGQCDVRKMFGVDAAQWRKELADAKRRLTYCDEAAADVDLLVKSVKEGAGIAAGAVLEYDTILTTRDEDRDWDLVEPAGCAIDTKSPLLWQHVMVQPIGKVVGLIRQDQNIAVVKCAIADTELGRDTATLVKFGALRTSHGFRPLEVAPRKTVKSSDGKEVVAGWHVKRCEVMEVSLVSVPSNSRAEILAWNEGAAAAFSSGKLHTPMVKSWAKQMYDQRPVQVPVTVTMERAKGNGGNGQAQSPAVGAIGAGQTATCACGGGAKMANAGTAEGGVAGKNLDATISTKAGRVLSKTNMTKLQSACTSIQEVIDAAGSSDGDESAKQSDSLVTKDMAGAVAQKAASGVEYQLEGSFEWIQSKLSNGLRAFALSKSLTSDDGYSYLLFTFPDTAIFTHRIYGLRESMKCYRASWSLVDGEPTWQGEIAEVAIAPQVIEKAIGDQVAFAKSFGGKTETPVVPTTTPQATAIPLTDACKAVLAAAMDGEPNTQKQVSRLHASLDGVLSLNKKRREEAELAALLN